MDKLSEEHVVFFKAAWARWFDKNGENTITTQDFGASIRMMMEAVGKPDDAKIQSMINEVEADSSGTMDFKKFLTLMMKNKVESSPIVREPVPTDEDLDGEANGDDEDGDDNI